MEIGRINLKNGVAEGFNPTDDLKTRTVVEAVSADPTVLREDRLGTAMVLGQALWSKRALTLAIAPKLAANSPPYFDTDLPRFDPMFDRTNAHTRALVKASFQLIGDVSPELLVLFRSRSCSIRPERHRRAWTSHGPQSGMVGRSARFTGRRRLSGWC